jgi:hypothetical protein
MNMGNCPKVVVASKDGFTSIPAGNDSSAVLAQVTLNEVGLWLIQARAEFGLGDGNAGNTGDVQCTIVAVPVAGLPEGGAAEVIDRSAFLLSVNDNREFVPYLGTVMVREPTHIRMSCSNFIIEFPGNPVDIFNPRLVAMKVDHVDESSGDSM